MPGRHVRHAAPAARRRSMAPPARGRSMAPAARGRSTAPAMAKRISASASVCMFIMAALIGVIIEHSVAPHFGVGYRFPTAKPGGTGPPAGAAIPRAAPGVHQASHAPAVKHPRGSAASAAAVPGAVRLTMLADRGPAAAEAFGGLPGAQPFVDPLRQDGSWEFGTAAIGVPAGVAAMPETALFLARASGGNWNVALDGTSAFAQMLLQAPSGLMPSAERQLLAQYNAAREAAAAIPPNAQSGSGRSSRSPSPSGSPSPSSSGSPSPSSSGSSSAAGQPARQTGLALPWTAGQSWTMTHVPGQLPAGADPLAMAGFTGGDGRVLSAGSGRIYRFCAGAGRAGDALIEVIHPDGSATEYYQVDHETTVPDGSAVQQGTFLGMTGSSTACGGSAGSRQAEFTLLSADGTGLDGAEIGGWAFRETLQPLRIWAERGGRQALPGKPLQNLGSRISPGNL
jgi:hypothetical protein